MSRFSQKPGPKAWTAKLDGCYLRETTLLFVDGLVVSFFGLGTNPDMSHVLIFDFLLSSTGDPSEGRLWVDNGHYNVVETGNRNRHVSPVVEDAASRIEHNAGHASRVEFT